MNSNSTQGRIQNSEFRIKNAEMRREHFNQFALLKLADARKEIETVNAHFRAPLFWDLDREAQ